MSPELQALSAEDKPMPPLFRLPYYAAFHAISAELFRLLFDVITPLRFFD